MTELVIGIGKDSEGNMILHTNHEGEPREIVLGKLSPLLVTILYQTAEFLEAVIEADNTTIH